MTLIFITLPGGLRVNVARIVSYESRVGSGSSDSCRVRLAGYDEFVIIRCPVEELDELIREAAEL